MLKIAINPMIENNNPKKLLINEIGVVPVNIPEKVVAPNPNITTHGNDRTPAESISA